MSYLEQATGEKNELTNESYKLEATWVKNEFYSVSNMD